MTPLEQLLDNLDSTYEFDAPPVWVQAFGRAHHGGRLVLGDDLDDMFGWVCPPDCWAVGVVAGGQPGPTDGPGSPATPAPAAVTGGRVRLACLLQRDGTFVARLRDATRVLGEDPPTAGRLFDALHRCLQLSTPAPERSPAEFLTLLWLSEVVGTGRRRWTWEAVAGLHPAVQALDRLGAPAPLDHLEPLLRAATRAWSWDHLRRMAAQGEWLSQLVPAELAAWMDDGMFARYLLDGAVSYERLLADACAVVGRPLGDRLARVVEATVGAEARPACGRPARRRTG